MNQAESVVKKTFRLPGLCVYAETTLICVLMERIFVLSLFLHFYSMRGAGKNLLVQNRALGGMGKGVGVRGGAWLGGGWGRGEGVGGGRAWLGGGGGGEQIYF